MSNFIPLSTPNLGKNEQKYVNDAVSTGWIAAGSYLDKLQSGISKYVGASGGVACQNGTAALHLALHAKGILGDSYEVIVPTLTFVAAVNPVKYVGADPIFMDCDDTLCLDMQKVKEFCNTQCAFINGKLINKTTQKHVAAIIPVHVFGDLVDMETLMDLAEKYNLFVLEDATEALGSFYTKGRYKGKYAGTIGNAGAYSFNANKLITSGGGGMVVANEENFLKRISYLSTQAKDDEVYFLHSELGFNYRMTNVQAAIGLAQFERIEEFIENKKASYQLYNKNDIILHPFRDDIRPNYWFFSYLSKDRDGLIKFLNENNVQSRPIWHLINSLKHYKDCQSYKIEKAPYYLEKIVNIPCSSNLEKKDLLRVASLIKEYEGR